MFTNFDAAEWIGSIATLGLLIFAVIQIKQGHESGKARRRAILLNIDVIIEALFFRLARCVSLVKTTDILEENFRKTVIKLGVGNYLNDRDAAELVKRLFALDVADLPSSATRAISSFQAAYLSARDQIASLERHSSADSVSIHLLASAYEEARLARFAFRAALEEQKQTNKTLFRRRFPR